MDLLKIFIICLGIIYIEFEIILVLYKFVDSYKEKE